MSSIYNALIRLGESVVELENVAASQQERIRKALKARPVVIQPDLFAAPANHNAQAVDTTALAQKLDIAIQRVEQVLKEA